MEHTVEQLQETIRKIDIKAEAGLCAGNFHGARAFHYEIREIAQELGLQGGLTVYQDDEEAGK